MKANKWNGIIAMSIGLILFACNNNKQVSDAFGNFEADDQIVASEIPGKLLVCNFEEGMNLHAGDLMALIDTVPLQLQVAQLQSQEGAINARKVGIRTQIGVIEQQKKNLQRDQKRIAGMFGDGAATQKQLDDVNGNLDVLDKQTANTKSQEVVLTSETEVVQTQKAQLNDKLQRCRIVSPVNGMVLEKYKKTGELAGQGQSLYRIADLSSLNLRVYVSGDQLPHVKIGQKVKVLIDETAKTNKTLDGTVTWIASEAEFTPKIIQTKVERVKLVYAVKVKVPNDGSLKVGMPGEIKFAE